MDKKKGFLNVCTSIVFKIFLLIGQLVLRRYLIQFLGNEINGIHSLYMSVIGILSVAELGVGNAITFCMYKPIVEKDNDKVSALYALFRKLYLAIGGVIFISGLIAMPFLPGLAKDYEAVDVNLFLTFGLMLASVVLTYLFSAKTSLINAHKNDYITTTISSAGLLLQYVLQIIALIVTQSFEIYLICSIVGVVIQWGATEFVFLKQYKYKITNNCKLDRGTKTEVVKNIKAMFMHKIGTVLVNSIDSLIISAYIGVAMLGLFTNYTTVVSAMLGVISLFFTPLTSVIGHLCIEESKVNVEKYFNFFHGFNFAVASVFFLGYFAVIDNIVSVWLGESLVLSSEIAFVITVNYFLQFMRRATLLFRDATGTFYNDRWKPVLEGVLNLVLSLIFVHWMGITGVIIATIITNVFICHIVEPYILYKHAFKTTAGKFYFKNYSYVALFCVAMAVMHLCRVSFDNQWIELFVNGGISLLISGVLCVLLFVTNTDFRTYAKTFVIKRK